ncbi:GNAT family N-acetyltransferase [Dryocola sp. BD613]|uniref:GNAT family N-acetyltransferase n=1 Tax=Dryocola sp. BD613 TaxID=3133272 RepID=UPI003F508A21
MEYQTERLRLRAWRPGDRKPFAALNGDPETMRYFPETLTPEESDRLIAIFAQKMALNGWGFWAVEEKKRGVFIGFVGLNMPGYALPFSPCVEIGWRLDKRFWGQGYAPEAARKALDIAFQEYGLDEVVAFTALLNLPSQRVMEKIAMKRGEEFDHPMVPAGHPLARHVVYRINKNSA